MLSLASGPQTVMLYSLTLLEWVLHRKNSSRNTQEITELEWCWLQSENFPPGTGVASTTSSFPLDSPPVELRKFCWAGRCSWDPEQLT